MKTIPQQVRLLILFFYVLSLLFVSHFVFESIIPPTTESGLWFYSGLATILLGSLLLEPFYSKPNECIANGVAAIISILAVNNQIRGSEFDNFLWISLVVYASIVIISSAIAIGFKDSSKVFFSNLAESTKVLSENIGKPRIIFSAVYWFSLIVFHRNSPREFLSISIAWVFIVIARPLELSYYIIRQWIQIFRSSFSGEIIGEIVGYQHPGITLIHKREDIQINFGDILSIQADDGKPIFSMALDHVGFSRGYWFRSINLDLSEKDRKSIDESLHINVNNNYKVIKVKQDIANDYISKSEIHNRKENLIGFVSKNSDISSIIIEVVRDDKDLSEGKLLEIPIGEKHVLFQIFNGLTQEEILHQKNERGYVTAKARKIGGWNEEKGEIDIVEWIPNPNSPVYLLDTSEPKPTKNAIGHFPDTNYIVKIDDINSLVTHNTAIIGILGVGKSYLGIELVERIINENIKVICLDLTDQYIDHLDDFYNSDLQDERIIRLRDIGIQGKMNFQKNVEEGGSINEFQNCVREILETFLNPDSQEKLLIYNPSDFEVWRQDSKPYKGVASMVSLSPAYITRIFAESALEILQELGTSKRARCCLVLEEAHSLIPEFGSLVAEGDKSAVNGTARAILQGRKFGLGSIVVTQRTANVTKTILNQCNSIFALRVFDATGMEFLKNYIGEDYSGILSTLQDRHAIFFGRASSCRDPVLIRLNDRKIFLEAFRDD